MISILEEIYKLDRKEVILKLAEKDRKIAEECSREYSCQDGSCGSCDYCLDRG